MKTVARRLDDLAERYSLNLVQRDRLSKFLTVIVESPRAPTAIRDPASAADQHLADALVGLEVDALKAARTIADLGSGAGLPGIPIAIALTGARVGLLESQSRKCEFLLAATAASGVANAFVVNARAEDWHQGASMQDAVLARALAPPAVVVEYAAPLLRVGGVLVEWRGRREAPRERAALQAAAQLGLELEEVRRVEPFDGTRDRHLHIYRKVAATPERFPRRAGIARKRPLGGAIPHETDRDRR